MLNLIWITLVSFLEALSGAVVPGPVFTLVFSESIKGRKMAAPLIILGHFIIEWIILSFIFLGLESFLESADTKIVLKYVGSAMLILMGLRLIKDSLNMKSKMDSRTAVLNTTSVTKSPLLSLIISGFMASCSNPYFFLWWLKVGFPILMGFIYIAGSLGLLSFLAGHAAADFLWFSLVGYFAYKGKNMLNQRAVQILLLVSAAFLIGFAFYMLFTIA